MNLKITTRQLSDTELDMLIDEVRKFFSPIVGYKDKWGKLAVVYIATSNKQLLGVCGAEKNRNWLMLHPFVVLEKYHGKGIGSLLMQHLVSESKDKNIFFGTQNVALAKIARRNGFKMITSQFSLPLIVNIYLIRFALESINIHFIKALYKKRTFPRGKFYFFIKYKSM